MAIAGLLNGSSPSHRSESATPAETAEPGVVTAPGNENNSAVIGEGGPARQGSRPEEQRSASPDASATSSFGRGRRMRSMPQGDAKQVVIHAPYLSSRPALASNTGIRSLLASTPRLPVRALFSWNRAAWSAPQ